MSKGIVSNDHVISSPSNWADHVFDDTCALPRLEDLEHFVQEHGHLPGVPSEIEVKDKGYSVHEVNVSLLKKIEELVLYSIQQEKEIKAQADIIERQSHELESLMKVKSELKMLSQNVEDLRKDL